MVALLDDDARDRLVAAVAAAEARTAAEFVLVVADETRGDAALPLLWAVLVTLLTAAPAAVAWPSLPPARLVGAESLVFVATALLASWPPIRRRLLPAAIRRRHAAALAREQFVALGLARTERRTGLMLFAALDARYVELLADSGLDALVPPGTWDAIVADFLAAVRAGRLTDGLVAAVAACADVLAVHVPRSADDRNELPDAPVEI